MTKNKTENKNVLRHIVKQSSCQRMSK